MSGVSGVVRGDDKAQAAGGKGGDRTLQYRGYLVYIGVIWCI